MTTNPTPDAVDSIKAATQDVGSFLAIKVKDLDDKTLELFGSAINVFKESLERQGFTITRQPAMTDAELEREMYANASGDPGSLIYTKRAIEIAKKYRG